MKLVSKKNGTTTIFSNLISAIARKIGFTPPTGMSATNVQGAIEEVLALNRVRVLYSQNEWANQHVVNMPIGSYHVILIAPQGTIWTGETWGTGSGGFVFGSGALISSALMQDFVLTVNMASQEGLTVVMFEHTEQSEGGLTT